MIITKNNDHILRLSDYGIEVPLLDTRPKAILDYLKVRIPAHHIQTGFEPKVGAADILRAHAPSWAEQVLADDPTQAVITAFELINEHGHYHRYQPRKAIKPLKGIAREAIRDCDGTLQACFHALDRQFAYFLGGGLHHAMTDTGAGFCLLNDSIIAIRKLQADKSIAHAWVIDIDAHKGDGTAEITQNDPLVTTFSIHMAQGWPLDGPPSLNGKPNPSFLPSNIDIGIAAGEEARYLGKLSDGLDALRRHYPRPDLVIVVGGSDPYAGDTLPSADLLKLTLKQMLTRDLMVHDFCKTLGVPQAWVMSGGYGDAVWRVHAQFLEYIYTEHDKQN